MARSKVTNLNIAATMDTKGVDEGAKKIERSFDRIEKKAKKTKTALDNVSDQLAGRFIALGAIISQTDRALSILYQTAGKGGTQRQANWWEDPNSGGGASPWKQFGIDSVRNAVSIGIGIGLQRYGGKFLSAGWTKATSLAGKSMVGIGAVSQAGSAIQSATRIDSAPTGFRAPVEVMSPEINGQIKRDIDRIQSRMQKSGIGGDALGLLSTIIGPGVLYSSATAGGTSLGAIAAGGAATAIPAGALATLVGALTFGIGKAVSDAFGGKNYRMSEAFGTMGGWVGIGRSNRSYKREAREFYEGAPALQGQIERARAARLAVQQPVLDMVNSMMSPAVAINEQRKTLTRALKRGMIDWDDFDLIESRLLSGGGRFGSGTAMPQRATRRSTETTSTDKLLMRIAERLEMGIPVKVK